MTFGVAAVILKIGNKEANSVPKITPPIIPPIEPSIDFLGDILSFNLCLPNLDPTNNAKVSTLEVTINKNNNKLALFNVYLN